MLPNEGLRKFAHLLFEAVYNLGYKLFKHQNIRRRRDVALSISNSFVCKEIPHNFENFENTEILLIESKFRMMVTIYFRNALFCYKSKKLYISLLVIVTAFEH